MFSVDKTYVGVMEKLRRTKSGPGRIRRLSAKIGSYAPREGQRARLRRIIAGCSSAGDLHAPAIPDTAPAAGDGRTGMARILRSSNEAYVAPKWVIEHPNTVYPAGGKKDEEWLHGAFTEICPLTQLVTQGSDRRLELGAGPPSPNRTEGCGCLQTIESDVANMVAGNPSYLRAYPKIEAIPHGWSFTNPTPAAPKVGVRHPADQFEWGYWTGGDTRETKEFYRTVAHEVCGHMAAEVQGVPSGRASGQGHNPAIIRENLVAGEHGVSAARQRGMDVAQGGVTPGTHRGESFLQATLVDYAHGSSAPPSSLTDVITSAIDTINNFIAIQGDRIRIQIKGFAYSNEGATVALDRVDEVKRAFTAELSAQRIALNFTPPGATASVSRFGPDIATVHAAGTSMPGTPDGGRRVLVFLYHRDYSAGP